VGVCCPDSAKSEIDGNVRMRRTAEDLYRESWLNSARAFFQESNVLFFGFTNAAKRGAEADADPILRFIVRILDSGVVERELGRRDGKLGVAIESLQSMRRKKLFRVPVVNLSDHANAESARFEIVDPTNAGFLGANPVPKTFNAFADTSDRTET